MSIAHVALIVAHPTSNQCSVDWATVVTDISFPKIIVDVLPDDDMVRRATDSALREAGVRGYMPA